MTPCDLTSFNRCNARRVYNTERPLLSPDLNIGVDLFSSVSVTKHKPSCSTHFKLEYSVSTLLAGVPLRFADDEFNCFFLSTKYRNTAS